MSVFEHNYRSRIYNPGQHPLKHTLDDFVYTNSSAPNVTTLQAGMDWLFTVLYPRSKPAVATPADLPLIGNTLLDYRVVMDDGDGKAASYRWEQREGDATPKWYKIYDMDWGEGTVLSSFLDATQDLYVYKYGFDDLDSGGTPLTGINAGQHIYGGHSASTNLTLHPNAGDAGGAVTGYVQVTNHFRPTTTSVFDLGTTALKFRTGYFATSVLAGTMTLSGGGIADSSGAVSFGALNLSTSGTFGAGATTVTSLIVGTTTITSHTLADTSGAFSFSALNVSTTGYFSGTTLRAGTMTLSGGTVADSSGSVTFGSLNLLTTGTLGAGATTVTSLIVGTTTITSRTLADTSGGFGFGSVNLTTTGTLAAGATTITGDLTATTVKGGNLKFTTNTLSSENTNGDIILSPNGTGKVKVTAVIYVGTDATYDLGTTAARFQNLYISGAIGDGTTTIAQTVLQSLRDINVGVGSNFTIFWNGTKWVSSAPDTEIDHTALSNLTSGDAGHTQFALLAGRSGGQSLIGGTAASNNLTFESTSNGTKGKVLTKDTFAANSDATFSVTWSGADLGGSSNRFRHHYSAGEFFGLRLENRSSDDASAASATGRLWWNTTSAYIALDNGATIQRVSLYRYQTDTSWDGSTTVKNVTVSGIDAQQALWQLKDNTNNYEIMQVKVEATTTTNVRITVNIALAAGSYRLTGLQ